MSESESEAENDTSYTPPDICDLADIARIDLVPTKSKALYETCYEHYTQWKSTSKIQSSSERVLLEYFKKLSEKYKPSTLWSRYSMLRTMIKLMEQLDIKTYHSLLCFIKKQSHGVKAKKSKVLTTEQINTFLKEAPDDTHLLTKVILIFGISGACRRDELVNMKVQDIEKHGELILVKVPQTKTSTSRSFTILPDFQQIIQKYRDLRPPHATSHRFFLNYKNKKCTIQVVGKNKIATIPKNIATYLQLPESNLYTGHCFRRTPTTVLADTGANITTLKRHGGWKSTTVAEGYIEESVQNKSKIASSISSPLISTKSTDENSNHIHPPPAKQPRLPDNCSIQSSSISNEISTSSENRLFTFNNCSNINITYNA